MNGKTALRIALLAGISAWVAWHRSLAWACECATPSTPAEGLAIASAVFQGTVTSVTDDIRSIRVGNAIVDDGAERTARFRVARAWKGARAGEDVLIKTEYALSACGFDFESGQPYLVYAHMEEGGLRTSGCSRTALASEAGGDIAALGAPLEAEPAAPTPSRRGCGSCAVASRRHESGSGVITLLLGFAAYLGAGMARGCRKACACQSPTDR